MPDLELPHKKRFLPSGLPDESLGPNFVTCIRAPCGAEKKKSVSDRDELTPVLSKDRRDDQSRLAHFEESPTRLDGVKSSLRPSIMEAASFKISYLLPRKAMLRIRLRQKKE